MSIKINQKWIHKSTKNVIIIKDIYNDFMNYYYSKKPSFIFNIEENILLLNYRRAELELYDEVVINCMGKILSVSTIVEIVNDKTVRAADGYFFTREIMEGNCVKIINTICCESYEAKFLDDAQKCNLDKRGVLNSILHDSQKIAELIVDKSLFSHTIEDIQILKDLSGDFVELIKKYIKDVKNEPKKV